MFINYTPWDGLTINTFRNVSACVGDIVDVAQALESQDEAVCCSCEGALAALEDGAVWEASGISQETLEDLHSLITRFNLNQEYQDNAMYMSLMYENVRDGYEVDASRDAIAALANANRIISRKLERVK